VNEAPDAYLRCSFTQSVSFLNIGLGRDSSGQQATIADGQDDRTGVIVQVRIKQDWLKPASKVE
jgi:hypothetical protein